MSLWVNQVNVVSLPGFNIHIDGGLSSVPSPAGHWTLYIIITKDYQNVLNL